MNPQITTLEEIQSLFEQMATQKQEAGLGRPMAEDMAAKQIIRDAEAGEIDQTSAKEFMILFEVSKGSTREAAEVRHQHLFAAPPEL